MQVIDISYAQGTAFALGDVIDNGIYGAVVRLGYRGYVNGQLRLDSCFERNQELCIQHNIPFAVYFMSQAINEEEAREEARFCVNSISPLFKDCTIFFDSELSGDPSKNGRADKLNPDARTKVVNEFCRECRLHGHMAGVYASKSWFENRLIYDKLSSLDYIWVAQYNSDNTCKFKYDMWQYTSKGNFPGYVGNVDYSLCYDADIFVNAKEPVHGDATDGYYYITVGDFADEATARKYYDMIKQDFPQAGLRRGRISATTVIKDEV